MDFRMLGPLSVGHRTVGRGRPQKILAALLLDANRPVSTDRLIDVVWGEQPPATARQQAQNAVGMLRQTLLPVAPGVAVSHRAAHYTLEVDEARVDGLVFTAMCRDAERMVHRGEPRSAAEHFASALDLWRGPALQGIDSSALTGGAQQLEERRLQAVKALVRLRFAEGRHADLIADLTSWTGQHPYDEDLHCRLADALHRVSRTAEALRVLRALRLRLADELGLSPSAATRVVELRLLQAEPPRAAAAGGAEPETLAAVRAIIDQLNAALTMLARLERQT